MAGSHAATGTLSTLLPGAPSPVPDRGPAPLPARPSILRRAALAGAAVPAGGVPVGLAQDATQPAAADLRPPGPAPTPRFSLLRLPPLPAGVRESRHRLLIAVLALHVPALLLVGADRGTLAKSGLLALPLLAAVPVARFLPSRAARSAALVLGLAWASYASLHLTLGASGAHLQPLLVVVLVALYQDPALLGLGLLAEVLALAVPAQLQPSLVFTGTELRTPWVATVVQAVALLGVASAAALAWRRDVPVPVSAAHAPADPDPAAGEHLQRARSAELALARRQTSYALMTSLARRNQSLIGRQLSTLDDLERDERDPDVLAGLFALDHLATRMRRNAENLLVLAGAPATSRGFSQPVPVQELLRGAAAEVEQYARVDVSVGVGGSVVGQVVSDVAHLLAELLDNALACSPPDSQVSVGAAPGADGTLRLWVADEGIGMTATRLADHNAVLRTSTDELEVGATLGFPVVKRLAARHGIAVMLAAREGAGSGLVAYVDLPPSLVVLAGSPAAALSAGLVRPAALPGRRMPRQAARSGRGRRNELAVDARREAGREGESGADSLFAPTPLPAAGAEDPVEVWGEPASEARRGTAYEPAGDPLPQRGSPAPATAVATAATAATANADADAGARTTPDVDGTDAPGATTAVPAVVGFLTEAPAEPLDQRPDPASLAVLQNPAPSLSAAVRSWGPAGSVATAAADTVVPATRTPLTRRVPQQALIEAGGGAPPVVFEPGPQTPVHPTGPTAGPTPSPVRAQDLLATYRAGLARARTAAGPARTATAPPTTAPPTTAPPAADPHDAAPTGAQA